MSRTDALWESYLSRIGAREMYAKDLAFRLQMDMMRDLIRHLGIVLQDEGVEPDVAERIIRGVLYGSPNAADAELRVREHEEQVKRLMGAGVSWKDIDFSGAAEFLHAGMISIRDLEKERGDA